MNEQKQFKAEQFSSLFAMEESVLKFWAEQKIFEKSLEKNPEQDNYSFYDGPPFITGMPHYATLLPSIAKDVIPRYQTMKGKRVRRVWGWDCHGLPAETQVEKKLGLKAKKDIEALGIDKFIAACRAYVTEVSDQWQWYIEHIGRWVDLNNAYRTDSLPFMESVLAVFKQLYDKGLIYRGRRVSLYCPRCATPLSKFETTMDDDSYKMVEDPAVTVAFRLVDQDAWLLAWTTTPWTLPANLALAVDPKAEYVKVSDGHQTYILAHQALERYRDKDLEILETFTGDRLLGQSYRPLYEFFPVNKEKDYKVYPASFVSMEEGTGIVHIAPGFGEDDTTLGEQNGLSLLLTVDDEGHFVGQLGEWAGLYYKKADQPIMADLEKRGLLFKREQITHSYPHCWRCGTPLLYKSQESWYMKIEPLKKELLAHSQEINWVPKHFGEKRFAHNIESAPDWAISRTRYWGTPIPVWQTDDGELLVPGSVEEIERRSGQKVTDLHRPAIDEIVLKTDSGKTAKRVKDVLDVWFESGSMPYAQFHYPFENQQEFKDSFSADFIVEYTGQLRGWFYYLHVLSNALYGENAFKNAAVTGVLMGTDGRKMSKSYGNYPDPRSTIEKYGAEALRLYFMGSKIMSGEDIAISEDDIREQSRLLGILHNSFRYFVTYANLHQWQPTDQQFQPSLLDQWLVTRLEECKDIVSQGLDALDFVSSTKAIRPFIEDLSTWYIRRSRDRFVAGDSAAFSTLYTVLVEFSKIIAPILPFSAEIIYRTLTHAADESVHLASFPVVSPIAAKENEALLGMMATVREIASVGNRLRAKEGITLRQPLSRLIVSGFNDLKDYPGLLTILTDELNIKVVELESDCGQLPQGEIGNIRIALDTQITPELRDEGRLRELLRLIQDARKKASLAVGEQVDATIVTNDPQWRELIEKNKSAIESQTFITKLHLDNNLDETSQLAGLPVNIEFHQN